MLGTLIIAKKAGSDVNNEVMHLKTIVKISEILYAEESTRSPKQILQLYNFCWYHHELVYIYFQV